MRFSGKKKKGRGFGSFAGGSTRGTPESHSPGIPRAPGVPGIPGTGGLASGGARVPGTPAQRRPLYGRKAAKSKNYTPLIIGGAVLVLLAVTLSVALTMNRTPSEAEEAVMAYIEAIKAKDGAAMYDLLCRKDKREYAQELHELNRMDPSEREAACKELGIEPGKLKDMTPRDYYIFMFNTSKDVVEGKNIFTDPGGYGTSGSQVSGDRATVTVYHSRSRGGETIHCVKEDGRWKIRLSEH